MPVNMTQTLMISAYMEHRTEKKEVSLKGAEGGRKVQRFLSQKGCEQKFRENV